MECLVQIRIIQRIQNRSNKSSNNNMDQIKKDGELVELAFNSRMAYVYNLSDMDEIVDEMIKHMKEQI